MSVIFNRIEELADMCNGKTNAPDPILIMDFIGCSQTDEHRRYGMITGEHSASLDIYIQDTDLMVS